MIAYLAFFAAGAALAEGWWLTTVVLGVVGLVAAELDRCKPDARDPIA